MAKKTFRRAPVARWAGNAGEANGVTSDTTCAAACSVFTSQMAREFGGELKSESLVRVHEGSISAIGDSHVLIVAKAELLQGGPGAAGEPASGAAEVAKQEPVSMQIEAAKTPAAALKSSAALSKSSPCITPASHPTPPSAGWCVMHAPRGVAGPQPTAMHRAACVCGVQLTLPCRQLHAGGRKWGPQPSARCSPSAL